MAEQKLKPFLVKILLPGQEITNGTGFFCNEDGTILTCYHVIKPYLDQAITNINVIIRSNENHNVSSNKEKQANAHLIAEYSQPDADLAVIKINAPANNNWPYLKLDVHNRQLPNDTLYGYGYPQVSFLQGDGIAIKAAGCGNDYSIIDDIEALPFVGLNLQNIDGGYSGAPIVNERTQKVVGLVYAKHNSQQAFMIPTHKLFASWPTLQQAHDVYQPIRKLLAQNADTKLQIQLKGAPLIDLSLECGKIQQENDAIDSELAQNQGRQWKEIYVKKSLLPPKAYYLLSSDVGTGKTVFLQWIATEIVRQSWCLPVLLECRSIEVLQLRNWSAVKQKLVRDLQQQNPDIILSDVDDCLQSHYDNRSVVFLLDGLDQIKAEELDYRDIVDIGISIASSNAMIISSRPSASLVFHGDPALLFLRLKPFSQADQKVYFDQYYPEAARIAHVAPELTVIPILAYMVKTLIKEKQTAQATTRTYLYQQFFNYIMQKHAPNVAIAHQHVTLTRKIRASLEQLSYEAVNRDNPQFQKINLDLFDDLHLPVTIEDTLTFGLVQLVVESSELQNEDFIYFSHQSFQEFLAAQYLSHNETLIDKIITERWSPKWKEVIKFLSGLIGESLIVRLLDAKDSAIHANLFLAAECSFEIKALSDKTNARLADKLNELAYVKPFQLDAINALGNIKATDSLLTYITHFSHTKYAQSAARTLSNIGYWLTDDQISHIMTWLDDTEPDLQNAAHHILVNAGYRFNIEQKSMLLQHLTSKESRIRGMVLEILANMEEQLDSETVHLIINKIIDVPDVSNIAVRALRQLASIVDTPSIKQLVAWLSHETPYIRHAALQVLISHTSQLNDEAVATILSLLADPDMDVRSTASVFIERFADRLPTNTINTLVKRLGDEDDNVREGAIYALYGLKEQLNTQALCMVVDCISDNNEYVQEAATEMLMEIADTLDQEVIQLLVALIDNTEVSVRDSAIYILGEIVPQLGDAAIDKIIRHFTDEDEDVREIAAETIGSLGSRINPHQLKTLLDYLNDNDAMAQEYAMYALAYFGNRLDEQSVSKIATFLHSKNENLQRAALQALGAASHLWTETLFTQICSRLDDTDYDVKTEAIKTLSHAGHLMTQQCLKQIVNTLNEKHYSSYIALVDALKKLRNKIDTATADHIMTQLLTEPQQLTLDMGEIFQLLGGKLSHSLVSQLVEQLHHGKGRMKSLAYSALKSAYATGASVPQ